MVRERVVTARSRTVSERRLECVPPCTHSNTGCDENDSVARKNSIDELDGASEHSLSAFSPLWESKSTQRVSGGLQATFSSWNGVQPESECCESVLCVCSTNDSTGN